MAEITQQNDSNTIDVEEGEVDLESELKCALQEVRKLKKQVLTQEHKPDQELISLKNLA